MNKKALGLAVLLVLSFSLQGVAAAPPGYEGGIKNESTYKEVIFLTGEPIVLEGTLDISIRERNNQVTERYTYKLENAEKNAKMSRTVSINKDLQKNGDQLTEKASIISFKETIDVNGSRYEATDKSYQWSKSDIYQNKPGVTYFAGNWDGRKTYTINKNQGKVTVETRSSVVGYDHYWGTTETQSIEYYIDSERTISVEGEAETVRWQGTAVVDASHNRTRDFNYEANQPTQISFRGGYLLTEQQENVLKVTYDLPRLDEEGKLRSRRNAGSTSFSIDTNPVNQRLNVPNMRDVAGHWAEKDILLLTSMDAFTANSSYFGPSLPMNRGEFARAIAVVMGLKVEEPKTTARNSKVTETPSIFTDVTKEDPNRKYITAVYEKGIMQGSGKDRFAPNQALTRAQAVTVLVTTLGFENLAPIQQYSTGFRDDGQIPIWAKDAVYMAKELGLVQGSDEGYFQPNKVLTKAEAVAMMTNFIRYLQQDLRYDYRERILNF
ncbi:S-layer homology domain-containing protein [Geosporobacter ferrireducens]|uniref:SLH domain-containing protein n=1 Tax=Geosporobacter ferrireducens TaxID=1424294 RepID=A0A1D8GGX0_9FIRM|nr:S-layer homology domain-containing protein [Geosporobacter ferrireducens]AOT70158.1 hypothetical protein Gferi_11480 [Geosporobacter ferrireducens]